MLYIHIPYCRKKCIYCDFFSGGAKIADWPLLRKALLQELKERVEELPATVESIYIGGGTPSLMPEVELSSLFSGVREIVKLSGRKISSDAEITLEANPEDVDSEHVNLWKEVGVNRVSLGIQTFSNELLKSIGRLHDGVRAEAALDLLSRNFSNISGDLIFGLPGQSLHQLSSDVATLLKYRPQHVSVYSLMYEEGTALTKLKDTGRIMEADEELTSMQYKELTRALKMNGYEHYEISNYSLPGYRSRHNSGYWTGKQYLGIGPSAHSFDGKAIRRANRGDLFNYLKRFSDPAALHPFFNEEVLGNQELEEERIMLSLRTAEGLDLNRFESDFGFIAKQRLNEASEIHIRNGNLALEEGRLHLSREGTMVSDTIIVDLLP